MIVRNGKNARSIATHTQDYFTDLGYDYRGHIYEKTVSPEILKNQNNKNSSNSLKPSNTDITKPKK